MKWLLMSRIGDGHPERQHPRQDRLAAAVVVVVAIVLALLLLWAASLGGSSSIDVPHYWPPVL
jgi:hypothetical protein